MTTVSHKVEDYDRLPRGMQWVFDMASKGLKSGPVVITLGREEDARSTDQNSLGWALWTDISNQVGWHGKKLSPEAWKELLSHEWKAQKLVPGISGGFCAIGVRTSKMKKREFSELIEITYAFGSSHEVRWSDKSSNEYDEYLSKKGLVSE